MLYTAYAHYALTVFRIFFFKPNFNALLVINTAVNLPFKYSKHLYYGKVQALVCLGGRLLGFFETFSSCFYQS